LGDWPFTSSLWLFKLPLHRCWVWLPKVWETRQAVSQILLEARFLCLTQVVLFKVYQVHVCYIKPDSPFAITIHWLTLEYTNLVQKKLPLVFFFFFFLFFSTKTVNRKDEKLVLKYVWSVWHLSMMGFVCWCNYNFCLVGSMEWISWTSGGVRG